MTKGAGRDRQMWDSLNAHLDTEDGQDGLGVDQGGVAQVVQAAVSEDLGASLEPHGLAEGGGAARG